MWLHNIWDTVHGERKYEKQNALDRAIHSKGWVGPIFRCSLSKRNYCMLGIVFLPFSQMKVKILGRSGLPIMLLFMVASIVVVAVDKIIEALIGTDA